MLACASIGNFEDVKTYIPQIDISYTRYEPSCGQKPGARLLGQASIIAKILLDKGIKI